ncbi:AraC family transcriptional regulator [Endozoicomonas sp. SCSIO W0465]|uniref:AraC family transcriptional regulator n=1 Tax=Endozoicomonas sp. SCSIO W0465 TaxID=2918516 RepID=UPI002075DAC3|nr:AraC family transcriptional regulator [Endozoicomonas sp. SCSIO W0465]USE33861.1 AraC family transcriptional regulator [Endozoicomonas sp. SCSIO W0465]
MNQLAQSLSGLAFDEGYNVTHLSGVGVFKASESRQREPLCYSQGIFIVAQGAKRIYLEQKVYEYNPENYLVLTLPIPAECETRVAPGEPLLSLLIDIDLSLLHPLVRLFDEHNQIVDTCEGGLENSSLYASPVSEAFSATVLKLANCLHSPLQSAALGRGLIQELLFLILCSEQAAPLFALARHNTSLARLERAMKFMHEHYDQTLGVEQLATLANMSPSTFHRNFRQMTASSPIQYLKKLRLSRARELLQDQGLRVNQAAAMVGYESPTQFSREFKRYFGLTPQQSAVA